MTNRHKPVRLKDYPTSKRVVGVYDNPSTDEQGVWVSGWIITGRDGDSRLWIIDGSGRLSGDAWADADSISDLRPERLVLHPVEKTGSDFFRTNQYQSVNHGLFVALRTTGVDVGDGEMRGHGEDGRESFLQLLISANRVQFKSPALQKTLLDNTESDIESTDRLALVAAICTGWWRDVSPVNGDIWEDAQSWGRSRIKQFFSDKTQRQHPLPTPPLHDQQQHPSG